MFIVRCYSACGVVTLIFSCSCREQDQDLAVAEKLMESLNKKQQRFSTYKLNNKKPFTPCKLAEGWKRKLKHHEPWNEAKTKWEKTRKNQAMLVTGPKHNARWEPEECHIGITWQIRNHVAGGLSENCKAPNDWEVRESKISDKTERVRRIAPKENPRLLMRALLQMTIATDDITDRHNAPTVPSWRPEASAMAPSLLCSKYRTLFFFFLLLW